MPEHDDERGHIPEVWEMFGRLERAGWSIGDAQFPGNTSGPSWVVHGRNEGKTLITSGTSRESAWQRAVEKAGMLGMLAAKLTR
jgi:hypothetical protein